MNFACFRFLEFGLFLTTYGQLWPIRPGNPDSTHACPSNDTEASKIDTVCIRDLDKLNLVMLFGVRLDPILGIDCELPQILLHISKVVKSGKKIIILLLSPRFSLNP